MKAVLRVAVADESQHIRLALVRFFDSRFDLYLCRSHHIKVRLTQKWLVGACDGLTT